METEEEGNEAAALFMKEEKVPSVPNFFFCPFNDSDVERNFPPKQDKLSNIAFKHNTFHDDRESLAGELCLKVDPVACKCQTQDELLRLLFSRLERAESVVI